MSHKGRPFVTDTERKLLRKAIEKRLTMLPDVEVGGVQDQTDKEFSLLTPYAEGTQGTFEKFFIPPFIKPDKKTRGRA